MGAIVFILLFLPPQIGLANNGDFDRVMGAFGISSFYYDDWSLRYFNFAQFQFDIWQASRFFRDIVLVSSHLLAIATAKALNLLFFSQEVFDIRFFSSLYCVVFLMSVSFIMTKEEVDLLKYFIREKLFGGVMAFQFPDCETNDYRIVRIVPEGQDMFTLSRNSNRYTVTLKLEVLP